MTPYYIPSQERTRNPSQTIPSQTLLLSIPPLDVLDLEQFPPSESHQNLAHLLVPGFGGVEDRGLANPATPVAENDALPHGVQAVGDLLEDRCMRSRGELSCSV